MLKLTVTFGCQGDLGGAYLAQGNLGGVFVPGVFSTVMVGERVKLELRFRDEAQSIETEGVVRWRRQKSRPGMLAGVGVEFATGREAWAGRPSKVGASRAPRHQSEAQIAYRMFGFTIKKRLTDVSRSGAFIETDLQPAIGTLFPVKIESPGGGDAIKVMAVSRWHRQGEEPGVGIRFLPRTDEEKQSINRLVGYATVDHLGRLESGPVVEHPNALQS